MTWKVTPWGTESGADPIFDWHGVVVVKVRNAADFENAGNMKVGIESVD